MRHPTLPWLLLLASCFSDSGGDAGTSTGDPSTTMSGLAEGTTSGPNSGPTSDQDPTTGSATAGDTSTGSATTGSTTGPVTTDPVTGEREPNCDDYCEVYAAGCVDFSEYDNLEACLQQCAQWPVGLANETAGDSLGCRMYHATVATTTDPDVHCPHAGPSGAGTCADPGAPKCEDYCATYAIHCKDFKVYLDDADCLAQCSLWYPGSQDQTQGDTLGCRLYHAGVALAEPAVHCPHAGPGGANVCVAQ